MVSLGGELGGLGATYNIWMGNLRVTMPFYPHSFKSARVPMSLKGQSLRSFSGSAPIFVRFTPIAS